jgi:uncharacterized membrane protein required for colicin V production
MWVDLLFLAIGGFAFWKGYQAGIIRMTLLVISMVLGLLLAMRMAAPVQEVLQDLFTSDNPLIYLLGFLLSFLLVIGLFRWIAILLENALGATRLGILNHLVGGLLYATAATLVLSTVLALVDRGFGISDETVNASFTWPLLAAVPDQVAQTWSAIHPILTEFWHGTAEALDSAAGSAE